jgi:hypothetical protein
MYITWVGSYLRPDWPPDEVPTAQATHMCTLPTFWLPRLRISVYVRPVLRRHHPHKLLKAPEQAFAHWRYES